MARARSSMPLIIGVILGLAVIAASLYVAVSSFLGVCPNCAGADRITPALATVAFAAGVAGLALLAVRRWPWAAVLVLLGGLAALTLVVLAQRETARPANVAVARPPMQLPGVELWPGGVVPVCWSGALPADTQPLQGAVREAEKTWERVAGVTFKDMGACTPGMAAVRLEAVLSGDNPDTPTLGRALLAQGQTVRLAFAFPSRSGCTRSEDDQVLKTCVYGSAVHEFGHVLGLPDVAYSTAADAACRDLLRGDHPALAIPYRPASVMNACDPSHGFGRLSDDDVNDIRAFYGKG
jgi:hypothetical protein